MIWNICIMYLLVISTILKNEHLFQNVYLPIRKNECVLFYSDLGVL